MLNSAVEFAQAAGRSLMQVFGRTQADGSLGGVLAGAPRLHAEVVALVRSVDNTGA